jgi:hypothetical protein
MLPWTKKKNIHAFYGEYAQDSVPNRIFNRFLDNDVYMKNQVDSIELSSDPIGFASRAEVQALTVSADIIIPSRIMALSATTGNITSGDDTRFVTANTHIAYMDNLATGVSYIDISYIDAQDQWPTAEFISDEAKTILGDYSPPGDTIIDVMFYYIVPGIYYTGWWSRFVSDVPDSKGMARYRYTIDGTTAEWTYIGRLVNKTGRLYQ